MRHLLPLLLLSGCGPIVQVGAPAPPPAALLTLSATGPAASPAGLAPVAMGEAVTLLGASAPASLQTTRIPVQVSETEVQYLKAAQWAEPPARLFVRLLADTLAGAGIAVVDRQVTGRAAPRLLGGELALFDVDVRGGSPRVRVRYDATLVGPEGVRQRRFEREAPVAAVEPGEVSRALNAAANAVAADVARWMRGTGA